MSIVTRQATANESPDTTNGIGGDVAVASPTNTGHAFTSSQGTNNLVDKSCRWSGFQNIGGGRTSIKLKVTHTSEGFLTGPSAQNRFNLSYTLNGGGAWTDIVNLTDFTTAQGPTAEEISLPLTQDLAQVQVRDLIEGLSLDPGDTGRADATISGIEIEVNVVDGGAAIMFVG